MAAKRKTKAREAQLAFEAIFIEGGLLSPEWLSKVAQLQAGAQSEADYRIPKGLNLRDEIGRYWRVAQAHWSDFERALHADADRKAVAERFVLGLLRDVFGFTSLEAVEPAVLQERTYPIGHAALGGRAPVVVAPAATGVDTLSPAFGDGSRRRSAFGLAQEHLNAEDAALWGVVTDGVSLRIVRDNASLTRPAWIEADLQRIFTEERYADFAALWLLVHESRFGRPATAGQPAQAVSECALEVWRNAGREEGTRAREHLRRGVEEALVALGQGFVGHPDNAALRAELQSGKLSVKDYFNQLLRLVYRLIFLLTVEERGLLHPEGTSDATKALYADGYGLRRLRERSVKRSAHDRFSDLWDAVQVVFRGVSTGEPRLGLPALAGIFSATQCPALDHSKLENRALLLAVFKLAWLRADGSLARVNWRDMGPEELGSVYESLLELVPQIGDGGREFRFATGGETKGNARKTSGSYYTPDSLVQVLLDSALEPVIHDTIAKNPTNTVEALLGLSIVDPACGSGHFLLAAARRLAGHVARLQASGTPSAAEYRHALRQVVGRCIFGVDLNPMAVELCKVGLWMEAVEPGLPLTFLDSHIQHGNALLGTTPELMANGIPDKAWDPIEGDDKKAASALKKRNKKHSVEEQMAMSFVVPTSQNETQVVSRAVADLDAASDADVEALAMKEARWGGILGSREYRHQKFVADAWCAAFVWPKQPGPLSDAAPTNELWRRIRDGQGTAPELTVRTVEELAEEYRFFHWHLQFPQVFARGGFDVVLGNPPWTSYTGRQQTEAPGRMLPLFLQLCPETSRWPATHTAFLLLAARLFGPQGQAGVVLPRQVGDLDAYAAARSAMAERSVLQRFVDVGEDAFPGVTQAVGLFVFRACESSSETHASWKPTSPTRSEVTNSGFDAVRATAHLPRFPLKTFTDPGVHTGNVSKKIVLDDEGTSIPGYAPIREGRDILPFACLRPRKRVSVNPTLKNGEYCTIRDLSRYASVPILVRQTADRPIAARHANPSYFRNSLLACNGVENIPDAVVVACLNSALFASIHRARARDAGQKAFPQVKVKHLQELPCVPIETLSTPCGATTLGEAIERATVQAELEATTGDPVPTETRLKIERLVLAAFGLSSTLAEQLIEEAK